MHVYVYGSTRISNSSLQNASFRFDNNFLQRSYILYIRSDMSLLSIDSWS